MVRRLLRFHARLAWLVIGALVPTTALAAEPIPPYPFATPIFGLAVAPDGSLLVADAGTVGPADFAKQLLRRWGVMFRDLLAREALAPPWRDLLVELRRMEARGEIRGGRFVTGMSGEQFALPEAVDRLREVRREGPDGRLVVINACDPLNLAGILDAGERIRAIATNRIAYRDGVPVSVMEGDYLRPLAEIDSTIAMEAATALAGRRVPVASGFVGR